MTTLVATLPAQHQYRLQTPGLRGCYLATTAWPSDNMATEEKHRIREGSTVWGCSEDFQH